MTDTDRKPAPPADINDPDRQNAEQDESGTQAQDVAQEALEHPTATREEGETERGGHSDPTQLIPDDTPDLVERMKDMDRSGRIDMGAFEGEENMDDEDGSVPE